MTNTQFPSLSQAELDQVAGGFNIGQIGQQIGGLVDSFTGGQGKGAQMGGQIGGFIQQLIGSFGGGGGGGGGAPGGGGGGEAG